MIPVGGRSETFSIDAIKCSGPFYSVAFVPFNLFYSPSDQRSLLLPIHGDNAIQWRVNNYYVVNNSRSVSELEVV